MKKINGYSVLFVHETSNTIHIEAVVHSGFIHETKHTSGINHLLEHVLVSAWNKCKGSCNTYWDEKGAIINASTEDTVMKYYVKGLASDVDEMVDYIASILTHASFNHITLENEKQAVIDELTASSGDPDSELLHAFNKEFFKLDGLQHTEDWKLQIKNLKHLTLKDLNAAYQAFNTDNILFIVYGQFDLTHLSRLFSKHLIPRNGDAIGPTECFSHLHKIVYTPFKMEGTTILIGFPSTLKRCAYLECFALLLHQLLFKEIRTVHKLMYDIEVSCTTTLCGTALSLKLNVRDNNIRKALHILFQLLKKYKVQEVESRIVESCKKSMLYKYYTDYPIMNYYTTFIQGGIPLTKRQLITKVNTFSSQHFKKNINQVVSFQNALCVYQGSTDVHLSWDMIY